jgi:hypothetical protein
MCNKKIQAKYRKSIILVCNTSFIGNFKEIFMNSKIQRIITVLITLALASLACATLTGGNPTVPTPPAIPTIIIEPGGETATQPAQPTSAPDTPSEETEPTPVEGGANPPGSDSINLDDPALYLQPVGVNTYQTSLVYTFFGQAADGTQVTGSITGEGAYSVDPYQLRFSFQTSESTVPGESLEIVQIENTLYMASAELGCFSLPVDSQEAENPYEELLDTGGFLTGQATRVQPDETVNDIPVYVYEITSANLDVSDPTTQEVTEITFGRLYIAQDGGYVVRMVLDGRGQNTILSDASDLIGDVHYEINYFGQNQPVNIAPPENCAEDTGGGVVSNEDYPIPEGAADLIAISGITTFSSDKPVEELTQFYKTEMVAAGWTMGEELSLPGLVTLTFTKDGKTATVTIAADPSTGKTQVTIFEG